MKNELFSRCFAILLVLTMLISCMPIPAVSAAETPSAQNGGIPDLVQDEQSHPAPEKVNPEKTQDSAGENPKGTEDSSETPDAANREDQKEGQDQTAEKPNAAETPIPNENKIEGESEEEDPSQEKPNAENKVEGVNPEKAAAAISIMVKPPEKTTYIQNQEELDLTGGEITVLYDDETTKTVPLTDGKVTGFVNTEPGTYTLSVNYLGLVGTFDIQVIEAPAIEDHPAAPDLPADPSNEIISIWVNPPSRTVYSQFEETLIVSDGEVWVTYADHSEEIVPLTAEMVSGFSTEKTGTFPLTVTYAGFSDTFDITVSPGPNPPVPTDPQNPDIGKVNHISISQVPKKLQYVLNQEDLDITGGALYLHTDYDVIEIPMDLSMITGFDNTRLGIRTLTVNYQGHTATFQIAIVESADKPVVLRTIYTSEIRKTCYYQWEALDTSGAEITRFYSDGKEEVIPVTENMVTGFDSSILGHQFLTIHDGEWECSVYIEIVERKEFSGYCGPDILWELDESGSLYLTGSGPMNYAGGRAPWEEYMGRIRSVYVGEGITTIGNRAFAGARQLSYTELPESLKKIEALAFYHCNLESVYFPSGLSFIGPQAFAQCPLHSVQLPGGITSLESGVFENCQNLESITLPEHLQTIEESAFWHCILLREITFPEALESISHCAFEGCTGLNHLIFPDKLNQLSSRAFKDCTGLNKITFKGFMPKWSERNIFDGVSAKVYYPGAKKWDIEKCSDWGGNLEWINTSPLADKIKFDTAYFKTVYTIGESFDLQVLPVPEYAPVQLSYSIEGDAVIPCEKWGRQMFKAVKEGTAVIVATDQLSKQTASIEVQVYGTGSITCPADLTVPLYGRRQLIYSFCPEETGEYVFSISDVYGEFYVPDIISVFRNGSDTMRGKQSKGESMTHFQVSLIKGENYHIKFDFHSGMEPSPYPETVQVKVQKVKKLTGIKIYPGNMTCFSLPDQESFAPNLIAKLYPEGAEAGEIQWSCDHPDIFLEFFYEDICFPHIKGEGPFKITATCMGFSDTITIQTKPPIPMTEKIPVSAELDIGDISVYSFTPQVSGEYTLTLMSAGVPVSIFYEGDNQPENEQWEYMGGQSYIHGYLTEGITYYPVLCREGNIQGAKKATMMIQKSEEKPTAIRVRSSGSYEARMNFTADCVPVNSYDKIIKWESSNEDILVISQHSYSSGNTQSFDVIGSGRVTVTATSEHGLKAACTVTVGECGDGHHFGDWRVKRQATCIYDGTEESVCKCGLTKYRSIPAKGHKYDNNCDPDCNVCGETREITHAFSKDWIYDTAGHWHVCTICGEKTGYQNHIPGPDATETKPQTCTECGCIIHPALGHRHSFSTKWSQSESAHWHECTGCGSRKDYHVHVYSGPCDATCNICGYERVPEHVPGGKWISDRGGHWQACSVCGKNLMYHEHIPGAPATSLQAQKCVICGHILEEPRKNDTGGSKVTIKETIIYNSAPAHKHQYENKLVMDKTGHWYPCEGCNARKDFEAHIYDNGCDTQCNICGFMREADHIRDPEPLFDHTGHWYICKDCGEKLDFETHHFSEGRCLVCGYEDPNFQETTEAMAADGHLEAAEPETTAQQIPQGIPWWVIILACIGGSTVTLGIVFLIIWVNRKKIVELLTKN